MRATSHPTRTVTIFLAPAMCKGENILVPWEYLFPNEKVWHVKFSPSQIPEQSQQELSEYCVEKQNQTIFKMVNYSQSHLVENIQVYQSNKNGAAQERGQNHGAWFITFRGCMETRDRAAPHFPWVCGFGQLYTYCKETGLGPRLLFCPLSPPQVPGNARLSDSFSSQPEPYYLIRLCPSAVTREINSVTHIGYFEVTLIPGLACVPVFV